MSTRLTRHLIAASLVGLSSPQLPAQDSESYEPVYRAWLEAGPVFLHSTDLSGIPGAGGGAKLELEPGFRIGGGSGYAFKPYFSLDWEVAVLVSSVKEAAGLDEVDASLTQVPFLINGTFQYQNQTAFTPFLGLGLGAASTAISVDELRAGATSLEGTDYDFVFAWQLAGGLRYAVNDRLGLAVLYKYLWTGDATWELESDAVLATGDSRLGIDGLRSHAIMAVVSYRF